MLGSHKFSCITTKFTVLGLGPLSVVGLLPNPGPSHGKSPCTRRERFEGAAQLHSDPIPSDEWHASAGARFRGPPRCQNGSRTTVLLAIRSAEFGIPDRCCPRVWRELRQQCCRNHEGLTKTCNRFRDCFASDPSSEQIRTVLHRMVPAVSRRAWLDRHCAWLRRLGRQPIRG